jgi:plastocyanin
MLPSFASETVTVARAAQRQSRGTTVPDWANAQRHPITGCIVQTPSTTMDMDARQQTALVGTLYAPPGSDIRAGDRIEWADPTGTAHAFSIVGVPMPWKSPTGRVSHVQATITEWEG